MNASQPIPSRLEDVTFGFLTTEDIKKLSVKRITNQTALDPLLLHQVPGGLYDPLLGAFGDNNCGTCYLNTHSCPGHCGHIELPVRVFHCTYMQQAYRLLQAQCLFCYKLRLSRAEINRYWCKLRLIRFGLLKEAVEIEDVGIDRAGDGVPADESSESEDDALGIIEKRTAFVNKALKKLRKTGIDSTAPSEAIVEARQEVITDFYKAILKTRKCSNCQAISPRYRKNKFTSIFRKPLSNKDQQNNLKKGNKKAPNALTELQKVQKRDKELKLRKEQEARAREQEDEGVADMESLSPPAVIEEPEILDNISEDMENENEEGSGEDIGEDARSTDTAAAASRSKKKKKKGEDDPQQVYVNPNEAHACLVHLLDNEAQIFGEVYNSSPTARNSTPPSAEIFFLTHLIVPPTNYRKEMKSGSNEITENPDNEPYRKIIGDCEELFTILKEIKGTVDPDRRYVRNYDDLQNVWLRLQDDVNSLLDSDRNPSNSPFGKKVSEGIKQKFEKKEGLFRMNVMGKRVNFAARSVISPDPNIESNEIGVPPVFARKLTYPEPVTPHNYDELKQAVINGPDKWPGAMAVEMENGQVINLRIKSEDERQAMANLLLSPSNSAASGARNKKVYRHLNNGDIVIMNRQPTLHKPSMMAHRTKILQGEKTIRMHYANCKTYNADFDGDEMNMHFPQNEIARAEALQIADADHQYISATAGDPLRGLIQDHISMGVWFTCQDSFFTREQYHEILYAALRPEDGHTSTNRILTVDPTILKPGARWTGKQIITTVLLNIRPESHDHLTFESKSSTPNDSWFPASEEGIVRIEDGEMLTGIMDKKQIGPSSGGLVHSVYEAYGPTVAGKLTGILGRLFNKLLNIRAFSCGVEDLILTTEGETARSKRVLEADAIGLPVAARYVMMEDDNPQANDPQLLTRLEEVLRDDEKQAGLDAVMNSGSKQLSTDITMTCLPGGLIKLFPKNQMQAMTTSGAKGTQVNANLISCNLGQQVLEGRRVPVMVSGKTLPSFKPFEPSVRAGGYIIDRFLTGIRPQEYFFHAMAGREGLIDTAVKTSRSGYLQRCLVKGLEGLRVEHDTSVRDSDGTMVQTLYGEDGLDIIRSQALNDFAFAGRNFMSLFASLDARSALEATKSKEAAEWNKEAIKSAEVAEYGDPPANHEVKDPALSIFTPARHSGSTSETFYKAVRQYTKENPHKKLRDKAKGIQSSISKNSFTDVMHLNYLRCIVEPGEAVGVVAGQSLGEPSTQMTLNTFHLAGHSAKNVTLGIPRLKEILMTASQNLKTPTMSLFPRQDLPRDHAEKFAKSISRISLADIIDEVSVSESVGKGIYQPESRIYKIQFDFYPPEEYTEQHNMKTDDVAIKIEHELLPDLRKRIRAEMKRRGEERLPQSDAQPQVGESSGRTVEQPMRPDNQDEQNEGGDSDRDDDGDDDAADAKRKQNSDEAVTYDDPDASDEEMAEQDERDEAQEESEDETYGGSPRSSVEPETPSSGAKKSAAETIADDRATRIVDRFSEVTAFSFPPSGESCTITLQYPTNAAKILLLPLVTRASKNMLITHIPSVATCTLIDEDNVWNPQTQRKEKQTYIHTDGVNLVAMRDYTTPFRNIIDPNRIATNDIGAMLHIYGVEAARACIVKELKDVFDSHSISVDYRHLVLVADYMTRGGGFKPFNRMGMKDATDLFKKMSFETTVKVLSECVMGGETDPLDGPSARITVGALGKMGTGAFDVLVPMDGQGIVESDK